MGIVISNIRHHRSSKPNNGYKTKVVLDFVDIAYLTNSDNIKNNKSKVKKSKALKADKFHAIRISCIILSII